MRRKVHHFITGNYTILLIMLFLLFIFRPHEHDVIYTGIWKTVLTASLIVAIFNCSHKKWTKIFISILAVPIIILGYFTLAVEKPEAFIASSLLAALFMAICAGSIVFDVVLRARVTMETLRGVICAYFLAAFAFAYVYLFVEYMQPGSMLIRGEIVPIFPHVRYLSDMLYYSFVTLLTVGYGDIVPAREWAQSVAVIEGIIGQFYIAILVARIVSVYSFSSDKQLLKHLEKDIHING
ncbi:MAG TPA: potassium channel family protein [Chlamydiales bacterium]|nr:potassium channel family protein [Chlamydiales bacterium]